MPLIPLPWVCLSSKKQPSSRKVWTQRTIRFRLYVCLHQSNMCSRIYKWMYFSIRGLVWAWPRQVFGLIPFSFPSYPGLSAAGRYNRRRWVTVRLTPQLSSVKLIGSTCESSFVWLHIVCVCVHVKLVMHCICAFESFALLPPFLI